MQYRGCGGSLSARYWWLGSTNPSNVNERNVNTSGALNNNNANNTNGVVPRL